MIEMLKKKRPFLWRKSIVVGVILLLVVRTIWFFPRTNWSIKDIRKTDVTAENVGQIGITPKDVRHVVLISIDTCRADHLGCYGYSRKTSPNLDALAADGVLFNHAVAPVPITLPSHSSMLTGTIPPYHGVRDNSSYRLAGANLTLAEISRENGFVTGAVIGAFVLDSQFGLDQGFDTYNDSLRKENKAFSILINERKGEEVTLSANGWLEKHRGDNFFLFLHYFDPHYPYELHKRFLFTSIPFLALQKDKYDSEIAYTDSCIGRVINKLKDLNLYDSTLLIVTADHGESLGEHSESSHGYFIYHSTLHVPLIVKAPGGPEGKIINDLVGLIDIVPTVCGLLGITVPTHVQGRDLSALFSRRSSSTEQRSFYCESLLPTKFSTGPFLGLVSDRWKYIHTLEPELYDLRTDPLETRNLLDQQTHQAHIMQKQLKLVLQNSSLNYIADSRVSLDEETRKRLNSLGYISSRTVDEDIQFDQKRLDPKKFIEFFNFTHKFFDYMLSKKLDKARKLCDNMLAKWPDMKQAHYYLGLIALSKKDYKAMITHFSRYLTPTKSDPNVLGMQVKPDYEMAIAHGNLGAALQHEGKIEQAIPHYQKALSYNPYFIETNYALADAYFKQGRLRDAIKYYSQTLNLDPNFPEAHYMLGNVLFKQEKFKEAVIHYNKALQLKPGWENARRNLTIAEQKKRGF